jgi:hypothetical protein
MKCLMEAVKVDTSHITDAEYSKLYRLIERRMHPDRPPATPDPEVAQFTLAVFRTLGIWNGGGTSMKGQHAAV